jgi:hypothetical protein
MSGKRLVLRPRSWVSVVGQVYIPVVGQVLVVGQVSDLTVQACSASRRRAPDFQVRFGTRSTPKGWRELDVQKWG